MGWVMSFLISWRGVVSFVVVFLVLKSGFYMPNHVFGVSRPRGLLSNFKRKWVMKLRIMIYHVPTKYKIFLSKGVLSPCNLRQGASSLDPWEHLAHSVLPTIQNWMTPMHKQRGRGCGVGAAAPPPIFWWQLGEKSHSGEFTIGHQWKHGIRAWNLWWKWYKLENLAKLCEFYPRRKQVSWTFKVLKPTSFRGLCTLDPRQGRPPDPTRGPKELLKLLNKSW